MFVQNKMEPVMIIHDARPSLAEILARSKDFIHDVKTSVTSRRMLKHRDNTCNN